MPNIISSIYWEQNNQDELVYKFPSNSISLGSVLTVNEGQEAFFYKSGTLCDSFTSGRHVLSTSNLPVLQKFVNLASGGKNTFLAEVWFVSKLNKRNMFWGTGGLRILDPYFQIPVKLSTRGQYGIRIVDGGLFLKKLIGTITFADSDLIEDQFRIDVIEAVKVSISQYMKKYGLNINELGSEYKGLAQETSITLQNTFQEYGVELLNFNIEDINIDESDKGYQTVMEGIAENAKLKKLGLDYLQQKQLDIAQTVAANEGAGNFMGIGMGLGTGNVLGNVLGNTLQNSGIASPTPPPQLSSYYVAINGKTTGPFPLDIIQQMIEKKEITLTTYVYKVGGSEWVLAKNATELINLFALMPPPPPPAPGTL